MPASPSPPPVPAGPARPQLVVMAAAAGLAVANIFYLHPLLPAVGAEFGAPNGLAAMVVTAGAVGYAAGLALLVPLGDTVDRRRLLVTLLLVVAAGQLLCAVAPTLALLVLATAALSVAAVVAPLLVAHAAALAEPTRRGAVTGVVMTGVLLGVLLARTGSGLLAEWAGGWRTVCAVAAGIAVALAAVLHRALPAGPAPQPVRYAALLASVPALVRTEPMLRARCALGFLCFGSFTALWTSLAFHLEAPPFGFGVALIGLVGLLGAVGAWCARYAGPIVDRGRADTSTAALLGVLVLGWAVAAAGVEWLVPLLAGVLLVDLAVQAVQVTNLAVSLGVRPSMGSRITTAYMTCYFAGGVVGSAASAVAHTAAGWLGVCAVGGALAAAGLVVSRWAPGRSGTRDAEAVAS